MVWHCVYAYWHGSVSLLSIEDMYLERIHLEIIRQASSNGQYDGFKQPLRAYSVKMAWLNKST